MIYALAALVLSNGGLLYLLKVQQDQHADEVRRLISGHSTERDKLLNRVQAPQTAVAQSMPLSNGEPKHISPEDDKALLEYREGV